MSVVKYIMLNEELRRKQYGLSITSNQSEALVTQSQGRSKTRIFHKLTNMRITENQEASQEL